MDKLDKIIANVLSERFNNDWKQYLTKEEQVVFILKYFKGLSTLQISFEIPYSQRQIQRILKRARKKINKTLP